MFVNNYIHNIHVVQLYNRYCGFAQSCFIALMGFNVTSIGHHLFRLICAPFFVSHAVRCTAGGDAHCNWPALDFR